MRMRPLGRPSARRRYGLVDFQARHGRLEDTCRAGPRDGSARLMSRREKGLGLIDIHRIQIMAAAM